MRVLSEWPKTISFFVLGLPKAWQRPQFNRKTGSIYTAAQDRAWRGSIWGQAMAHKPERPFEGPITLTLSFRFPIPKSWPQWKRKYCQGKPMESTPDLDNVAKAVIDALTGIYWLDDKQIWRGPSRKQYVDPYLELGGNTPGVRIEIAAMQPTPKTLAEWKQRQAVTLAETRE